MTISPVSTALTLSQSYGFPPALAVPVALPAVQQPTNPNPSAVTGVIKIYAIASTDEFKGQSFDEYA